MSKVFRRSEISLAKKYLKSIVAYIHSRASLIRACKSIARHGYNEIGIVCVRVAATVFCSTIYVKSTDIRRFYSKQDSLSQQRK